MCPDRCVDARFTPFRSAVSHGRGAVDDELLGRAQAKARCRNAAVRSLCAADAVNSAGSSGVSMRVRSCIVAFWRRFSLVAARLSACGTGHGATHTPQRTGLSCDHSARSRHIPRMANRIECTSRRGRPSRFSAKPFPRRRHHVG